MPKEQVLEDIDAAEPDGNPDLDEAISDLRGVLEEDAAGAGSDTPGELPENPAGDFSLDDMPDSSPDTFSMDDFPDTSDNTDTPLQDSDTLDMNDFGSSNAEMPSTTGATGTVANSDIIMDIPVEVQIVLGKTHMKVSSLMQLDEGATISLDRKIGESVDIMVNGRMIGHGEITVLEEDETRFGIKLTSILGTSKTSGND
ncbi:MAG: flagellar motor switch protein FliN [Alphaproteobacteria bacterium]|nr:flagellar motor switch protein FliN [Alphaproteobacteria bacterium]